MDQRDEDVMLIRDLIERWAVYRDALLWDRFRALWREEGRMKATWFEGPFEEFIRVTAEGVARGLNILHILGGSAIEVRGSRATSMTKLMILQRAVDDGLPCDITAFARHRDLWDKRDGGWGLVRRPLTGGQAAAAQRDFAISSAIDFNASLSTLIPPDAI